MVSHQNRENLHLVHIVCLDGIFCLCLDIKTNSLKVFMKPIWLMRNFSLN